jgi:hypothetical protein
VSARGTAKHWTVGRRVQVPAYSDLWMRGARFGTVERWIEGKGNYIAPNDPRAASMLVIRMDHPQVRRLARFPFDDCTLEPVT